MGIREATISTLEDKRADYMDAIEGLEKTIEALSELKDDELENAEDMKSMLEMKLNRINEILTRMEQRQQFTNTDN